MSMLVYQIIGTPVAKTVKCVCVCVIDNKPWEGNRNVACPSLQSREESVLAD